MKNFNMFLEGKRQDLIQNAIQKIESAIEDLKAVGLPKTMNSGIAQLQQFVSNLKFAGGLVADEPENPVGRIPGRQEVDAALGQNDWARR